ncbi:PREDICTED: solute carrier family 2, facilitated glucose transporter member 4, partial [Pseudopodoces humilis]|uniref:solute carrier family 2, facilitated glucose transporter member 4 n=1 Tax=Pseudopodoces humilis TaxID=181119 RepID=UPI0006B7D989
PALALTVFAASLSSLSFGFHIGVINAPQKVLEGEYNATWARRWGSPPPPQTISLLWALSVAIFSVGGMGTALAGGAMAERLGRKGALLATNGLAVVGGALMGGAKLGPTYTLIILGRFVVGAYSGLVSVLVPLYVGEVAPLRLRGALGTLHQLGIVLGILAAQVLGLRALLGTPAAWPALFGAGLLPAALQLLLLPLCPESPRFLLARGQRGRARRGECGAFGLAGPLLRPAGLAALEAELGRGPAPRVGLLELLRSRRYRQPLIVTLGLQLAQQLSGINAIFYYSTSIFEGAGLQDPAVGTIGTGVVNVAATALSVVLVERAGRRLLQLVGLLGMMACAATLGVALKLGGPVWGALALGAALAFVGFFAVGPGPLPWFVGAELFPPGPRGAALALAGLVNWASNTAVAMAFPALQDALGPFVFLLFGGLLGGFALFTFLLLPETRGRPFPGPGDPQNPPPAALLGPPEKDTELQCLASQEEP